MLRHTVAIWVVSAR